MSALGWLPTLPMMLRRLLFGFFFLSALLGLLVVALARPAAEALREKLVRVVNQACDPCDLHVDRLSLGLSPPRVELAGISFVQGDPRDSAVTLEATFINVPVPLFNLTRRTWRLGLVKVEGLRVELHEGDLSLPVEERKQSEVRDILKLECEGISVSDGAFTYRKDSSGGAARLHLTGVDADLASFGTFGPWRQRPLEAKAHALLERSGRVFIEASTRLDQKGPFVDMRLSLKGQRLREVNSFFLPEEGVSLAGRLLESRSTVKVRDARAEGNVAARYEGLEVMFHASRHRGPLEALFKNLGALVKVNKGNSDEPRRERERGVVTRRHEKESVVSFILRTLKEAALRVATG